MADILGAKRVKRAKMRSAFGPEGAWRARRRHGPRDSQAPVRGFPAFGESGAEGVGNRRHGSVQVSVAPEADGGRAWFLVQC